MGDLGLCMNLNRAALMQALDAVRVDGPLNYVEIGVYNGDTMFAVCEHLNATRGEGKWTAFGVERPGWEWEGHCEATANCLGQHWHGLGEIGIPHHDGAKVFPVGSGAFLKDSGVVPHFMFIDGCHSRKCFMMDFVMTEVIMPRGGVVAIHDIDLGYQNLDPGSHCPGEGIAVLAACRELKLLDSVTRPGWREIGRTPEGFENHGLLFVQRV